MTGTVLLGLRSAIAVILYAFISSALYILWRDLRQQQSIALQHKFPALQITGAMGEEHFTKRFTTPEILIGRDATCELHLSSETVSAQHARLSYHHGQWWLEDLGSTNGSYLNQNQVLTPTVVTDADQICCGEISLNVSIQEQ